MNKRLRSPENTFHSRQEKKFITPKDLDLMSEDKMKQIYSKTMQFLYNGANHRMPPSSTNSIDTGLDAVICCSRFSESSQTADANGNSEMFVASCSFCDKKVCNNCSQNCLKCYKLYCSHCCISDFNDVQTAYVCLTCYH